MPKNCFPVFLSKDKTLTNIHTLSDSKEFEQALKVYLQDMTNVLSMSFSRAVKIRYSTLKEWQDAEINGKISAVNEVDTTTGERVRYRGSTGNLSGVTTFWKQFSNDVDFEEVARELTLRRFSIKELTEDYNNYKRVGISNLNFEIIYNNSNFNINNYNSYKKSDRDTFSGILATKIDENSTDPDSPTFWSVLSEKVETKLSSGDKDFKEAFEEEFLKNKDIFAGKPEIGTKFHDNMESFFKVFNELKSDINSFNIESIINKVKEKAYSENITDLKEFLENESNIVRDILRSIGNVTGISSNNNIDYNIYPEFLVADEQLGLASKLDLVVEVKQSNGIYKKFIFDYKTKEKGKYYNYDRGFKNLKEIEGYSDGVAKPILGNLKDSPKTLNGLQLATYNYMLSENTEGEVDNYVIYIEGELNSKIENGEKVFYYKNFSLENSLNSHQNNSDEHGLIYFDPERATILKVIEEYFKIDNTIKVEEAVSGIEESINILYNNNDLDDSTSSLNFTLNRLSKNPHVDAETKKTFYWALGQNNKKIKKFFTGTESESERKEKIRPYLEYKERSKQGLTNAVLNYFSTNKWDHSIKNAVIMVDYLLKGIDNKTYTLNKLNSIPGFESVSNSILIARNKLTGSVKIIDISTVKSFDYKVDSVDGKSHGIFSRYISDSKYRRNYNTNPLAANTYNLRLLRCTMLGIELKRRGLVEGVETVSVGYVGTTTQDGVVEIPQKYRFVDLLHQVKVLSEVHHGPANEIKNTFIELLQENKKLLNIKEYEPEYNISILEKLIDTYIDAHPSTKENLKKKLNVIQNSNSFLKKIEYVRYLHHLQKMLASTLPKEIVASNFAYKTLSLMILQQQKINYNIVNLLGNIGTTAKFRVLGEQTNSFLNSFAPLIQEAESKVSTAMYNIIKQLKKQTTDLLDEANVNFANKLFSNDSYELWKNCFLVDIRDVLSDPVKLAANADKLFRLKDPSDNSLTPEQRKMIEFFNATMLQNLKDSCTEEEFKRLDIDKWVGLVPLIPFSKTEELATADSIVEKGKIKIKQIWGAGRKNSSNNFEPSNYHMQNQFITQLNDDARYSLLGLNPDGSIPENWVQPNLETNLGKILLTASKEAQRAKYMNEALTVLNAMSTVVAIEQDENYKEIDSNLKDLFNDAIKYYLFGEVKKQKGAETIDNTQKLASKLLFGFSPLFYASQAGQNLVITAASLLEEQFKRIFGVQRFKSQSWLKAGSMMASLADRRLISALGFQYAIISGDSETLARDANLKDKANYLLQDRWLFWIDNKIMHGFILQTFITQFVESGLIGGNKQILELKEDTGEVIYHVHKDPRWAGIFDEAGNLKKDIPTPNVSFKENPNHPFYVKKRYEFFVEEMQAKGLVTAEGKPSQPFTPEEIMDMKNYGQRAYGGLDKQGKAIIQQDMWGRLLAGWKGFFINKFSVYWKRPSASTYRHDVIWIEDPSKPEGGYFEKDYYDTEGLINTVWHIFQGIKANLFENGFRPDAIFSGENIHMHKNRKENISKLMSHLTFATLLTVLASLASTIDEDDEEKTVYARYLEKVLTMSASEMNFAGMLLFDDNSILTSSPFAIFTYVLKTTQNLLDLIINLGTGDTEEAAENTHNILKKIGFYRSIFE